MKKLLKKNQVIITALAIMIAVAGYLNFTSDKQVLSTSVDSAEDVGAEGNTDDAVVSASVEDAVIDTAEDTAEGTELAAALSEEVVSEEDQELAQASLDENGDPIDSEHVGETVLTSATVSLSEAKLNREQTRSKEKEMLLEIVNNESLSEDAKQEAISKMLSLTERMEKENAAETQLSAKGFTDSVVSISDGSVDVT
jgi:stage III sporulation protein AH